MVAELFEKLHLFPQFCLFYLEDMLHNNFMFMYQFKLTRGLGQALITYFVQGI